MKCPEWRLSRFSHSRFFDVGNLRSTKKRDLPCREQNLSAQGPRLDVKGPEPSLSTTESKTATCQSTRIDAKPPR